MHPYSKFLFLRNALRSYLLCFFIAVSVFAQVQHELSRFINTSGMTLKLEKNSVLKKDIQIVLGD